MTAGLRDPATLLAAWEAGMAADGIGRGAAVVATVDQAPAPAYELSLGHVAARASGMLAGAFGRDIDVVVECEACATLVEMQVPIGGWDEAPSQAVAELGSGRTVVRAPTVGDLVAVRWDPDPRAALVRRCVGQQPQPGDEAALAAAFEVVAGPAVPQVSVRCPDCGGQVDAVVDVAALLWQRVERAATTLLREVADLASAFGWSEAEVLAMSPARRQAYLLLVAR